MGTATETTTMPNPMSRITAATRMTTAKAETREAEPNEGARAPTERARSLRVGMESKADRTESAQMADALRLLVRRVDELEAAVQSKVRGVHRSLQTQEKGANLGKCRAGAARAGAGSAAGARADAGTGADFCSHHPKL